MPNQHTYQRETGEEVVIEWEPNMPRREWALQIWIDGDLARVDATLSDPIEWALAYEANDKPLSDPVSVSSAPQEEKTP